ncbi:MAG: SMP-30/gluconolactonase/LRE family protein [Mucinivorans sp.]
MRKYMIVVALVAITINGLYGQKRETFDLMSQGSFTAGIEGPATDAAGYIYAVNFEREGTIARVDPETGVGEILIDLRTALGDSATANGLRFGRDSLLYVAEYKGHNLLSVNVATKELKVVAHNATMTQPNDLAIAPTGTIYLSDPDWSHSRGRVWIYKKGNLSLLLDGLGTTNGIEVSPMGERLYVGLSAQRRIMLYDIMPDGRVSGGRVFAEFTDGGLDGMRCDIRGNLFVTRYDKGQVVMISPEGKIVRTIETLGKKPSNLTFSDNMVFVTMADRGCFEVFQAQYVGRE